MSIYILLLTDQKYYIGKSNDTDNIIENIIKSNIAWITLYKPISIIKIYESTNLFEEDNITKQYMFDYGIENVRGGIYINFKLDESQIKALEYEFSYINDKCYKCKKNGHASINCNIISELESYLLLFNTIDEINDEIERLEKTSIEIKILNNNINMVKDKYKDNYDKIIDECYEIEKILQDHFLIHKNYCAIKMSSFSKFSEQSKKTCHTRNAYETIKLYFIGLLEHKKCIYKLNTLLKKEISIKLIQDKIIGLYKKQINNYDIKN
jgi:hypothetical protein